MRRCHRGATNCIGGRIAAIPGRSDADARRKDVYTRTVVGKTCPSIVGLRGAHRDRGGCASGAVIAGIGIAVPRGDGKGDPCLDGARNGLI